MRPKNVKYDRVSNPFVSLQAPIEDYCMCLHVGTQDGQWL